MGEPAGVMPRVTVRDLRDAADMATIVAIRHQVFVLEQGVATNVSGDPHDRGARHVLGLVNNQVVGVGRLHVTGREGQIAWVAVLPEYRRLGVGDAVMRRLIELGDRAGLAVVLLNAQTHARRFYERLGFQVVGHPFYMSGIEHQLMSRLSPGR